MSSFEESAPTGIVIAGFDPGQPPPPDPVGWEVRARDGTILADITDIAMNKTVKRRLNRPAECSFRVPSYMVNEIQFDGKPLLCAGYRQLSVTFDSTGLFFHGIVWNIEEDGDEDMVYSQVTCYDPMVVWRYRPARDNVDSYSGEAGNFSDPSFLDRNKFGGLIMQEILTASEFEARIPSLAEGSLFLDLGASTFAGGGADLSGAPTNWPMTIAEIATLLTNTGELDIVISPITEVVVAPTTFANMGVVDTYTGNYGTDRTASVNFDYATGDYNARLFRRSEGMDTIGTKLWYFLGPRLDQQHWRSNVTGDHPLLETYPSWPQLEQEIDLEREATGVYMPISIYDNFGTGSGDEVGESSFYPLYVRQWMVESLLRLRPRNMVYITPVRGGDFGPGDFDIGDLITINIGDKARVAESGAQRIYGYTIEVDDDGVEALGEFISSPDQDSI